MIFDTIRLVGPSNTVSLPLRGAQPTDPYIVKDVDGLGPSEVMVNIKNTLTRGGIMQSLRPENKQIDLLVKLNPDYTAGQRPDILRDAVYRFLAPVLNRPIRLELVLNNNVIATIAGYLGRVIPNPFSKDPEIQVSMSCLQAYFSSPVTTQFPSVSLPTRTLYWTFDIEGTAPTPFLISLTPESALTSFTLKHYDAPTGGERFAIPMAMAAGSEISIGGTPGERFATYKPSGQAVQNVIGKIGQTSTWLNVFPGSNTLEFPGFCKVNYFYYTPKYQGI